jgi:hypothetical protein
VPAGGGFIFQANAQQSVSLCFPLYLPSPVLPLDLPPGFSLVCCQSNAAAGFEGIVGRAPDPGTQVYKFNVPSAYPLIPVVTDYTNFTIYTFTNGAWTPDIPVVAACEAVWILQPPRVSNLQIAGGKFSFDATTASNAVVAVEYSDTVDGTSAWQPLTNLLGNGSLTNVVDDADVNLTTQRFYRLKLQTTP